MIGFVLRWLARLLMLLFAPVMFVGAALSGEPGAMRQAGRWFAHQWRDP